MDSKLVGNALNAMQWNIYSLPNPRFGFLTGDSPILISNALGENGGFAVLAISPSRFFIAAHDPKVIQSFVSQRPNGLEEAFNDACARQSHHVIIANDHAQTTFIDRRFRKRTIATEPNGLVTWNSPLIVKCERG